MIQLSKNEARKVILQCQRLAGLASRLGVRNQALNIISNIGYVQIDTISVIERAHHHNLWTRVEGYKKKIISQLEQEKKIFEYWSHAASYLPIESYRYTLPVKNDLKKKEVIWYKKNKKEMRYVLDRIKSEGSMMSRDFDFKTTQFNGSPDTWGPKKVAFFHLFMEGNLIICRREGFQKVYDTPERWLPANTDLSEPTRKEYLRFLIKRDLKAHGLMKANEFGYLLKGIKKELSAVLDEMHSVGEIKAAQIDKASEGVYYFLPESLELLEVKGYRKRLKILSPFDNLIINRKRTKELFDFDYILECYVPAKKRQFGYFGLPILWGERLIGQIDLKADRKNKDLIVRNLEFNDRRRQNEKMSKVLMRELYRLMVFNQCEKISFQKRLEQKLEV